ncbi:MAG: helix-turn-helix domain-containing protein [Candidatus Schekmanbacteria bacterium]|nr:helix-turn-helix domain-containing protein [Candidatus Schekmanbacteria bacterium]
MVALRTFVGLTQVDFARALGVAVQTLQDWEDGSVSPEGPVVALLRIAARHPKVIRENLTPAA